MDKDIISEFKSVDEYGKHICEHVKLNKIYYNTPSLISEFKSVDKYAEHICEYMKLNKIYDKIQINKNPKNNHITIKTTYTNSYLEQKLRDIKIQPPIEIELIREMYYKMQGIYSHVLLYKPKMKDLETFRINNEKMNDIAVEILNLWLEQNEIQKQLNRIFDKIKSYMMNFKVDHNCSILFLLITSRFVWKRPDDCNFE